MAVILNELLPGNLDALQLVDEDESKGKDGDGRKVESESELHGMQDRLPSVPVPAPVSVYAHLKSLYRTYGEFVSFNSYLFCHDPLVTQNIFRRLRTTGPTGAYWETCAGAVIKRIHDITVGYDSSQPDHISDITPTPDTEMIMYEFDNDCSGT